MAPFISINSEKKPYQPVDKLRLLKEQLFSSKITREIKLNKYSPKNDNKDESQKLNIHDKSYSLIRDR